jgi:Fe-S oxidoreductase
MEPAIGKDLVAVLEHNGIACSLAENSRCCGAPWLHGGDVPRFTAAARRNVAALAAEVRAGRDVVVGQPTCAYVIRKDYPIYAPGADADLVAAHAFTAVTVAVSTPTFAARCRSRSCTTLRATCELRTSASRAAT